MLFLVAIDMFLIFLGVFIVKVNRGTGGYGRYGIASGICGIVGLLIALAMWL